MTDEELAQYVKLTRKYAYMWDGGNMCLRQLCDGTEELIKERDALKAENERLRAAIETIHKAMTSNSDYEGAWLNYPEKPELTPADIARKALSVEGE